MSLVSFHFKFLVVYIPVLAWRLSRRSLFQLPFLYVLAKLYWFSISRKLVQSKKPVTFSFYFRSQTFTIDLVQPMDISGLAEIYVQSEYDWNIPFEVKTVLDLGAHWGDTATYYALRYPQANIFAVEPASVTYKRLLQVVAGFSNIKTLRGLLGLSTGVQTLHTSDNSLGNSNTARPSSLHTEQVQAYTLKDLSQEFNTPVFDLLKFDIEGAEEVLFTDKQNLGLAKAFIGEIHYDLISMSETDILDFFTGYKVKIIQLSKTRSILQAVNPQYVS